MHWELRHQLKAKTGAPRWKQLCPKNLGEFRGYLGESPEEDRAQTTFGVTAQVHLNRGAVVVPVASLGVATH